MFSMLAFERSYPAMLSLYELNLTHEYHSKEYDEVLELIPPSEYKGSGHATTIRFNRKGDYFASGRVRSS